MHRRAVKLAGVIVALVAGVAGASGARAAPFEMSGHKDEVTSLSITRDGRWLLSSGNDGTLRLWDLASGKTIRVMQRQYARPIKAAVITPDGSVAVSATGNERSFQVWDVARGVEMKTLASSDHESETYGFGLSPDGTEVLSIGNYGATLWEIPSGREIWGRTAWSAGAAFTPDGKQVLISAHGGKLHILDAGLGGERAVFESAGAGGYDSAVALQVAPDGSYVLADTGGSRHTLERWDLPSRSRRWTVETLQYGGGLSISPDGRLVVSAGAPDFVPGKLGIREPTTVRVRDADSGKQVHAIELPRGRSAADVAFSPDGKRLVIGLEDGGILRYDHGDIPLLR
jgi:WD40 repeat protein